MKNNCPSRKWHMRGFLLIVVISVYASLYTAVANTTSPQMIIGINNAIVFLAIVTGWLVLWKRTMDSSFPILRMIALGALSVLWLPMLVSVIWNMIASIIIIPLLAAIILFSEKRQESLPY